MIISVTAELKPNQSKMWHFRVSSVDDILMRGSVFKKYDFEYRQDGSLFTILFQEPFQGFPRLTITNGVGLLSSQDIDSIISIPAGMPVFEVVAQKMIGDGNES